MDYAKFGQTYYLRLDRGDEIVASILALCEKEGVRSAVFCGIGGCSEAQLQTFIPERGEFETERISGMLELASLMGNVVCGGDGGLSHHTHAVFAFKEAGAHRLAAGHLKASTVLYTAEIELRPVTDGVIRKRYDPETGTGFWAFDG